MALDISQVMLDVGGIQKSDIVFDRKVSGRKAVRSHAPSTEVRGLNVGEGEEGFLINSTWERRAVEFLEADMYYRRVPEVADAVNTLVNAVCKFAPRIKWTRTAEDDDTRDFNEWKRAEKFLRKTNLYNSDLKTTIELFFRHFTLYNEGVIFMEKRYFDYNPSNRSISQILVAVQALNPKGLVMSVDNNGRPGKEWLACVNFPHRKELVKYDPDLVYTVGNCPFDSNCKQPLYPVWHLYNNALGTGTTASQDALASILNELRGQSSVGVPFLEDEIIKEIKDPDNELRGSPHILKARQEIQILMNMRREYLQQTSGNRMPQTVLYFPDDVEITDEIKNHIHGKLEEGNAGPVVLSIPGTKETIPPNVLKIPSPLETYDMFRMSESVRLHIASLFGLTPEYVNAAETKGGQTVTMVKKGDVAREIIIDSQLVLNRVLLTISENMAFRTITYFVDPPDEKAASVKASNLNSIAQSAGLFLQMGFKVQLDRKAVNLLDAYEHFKISDQPIISETTKINSLLAVAKEIMAIRMQMDQAEQLENQELYNQLAGAQTDQVQLAKSLLPDRYEGKSDEEIAQSLWTIGMLAKGQGAGVISSGHIPPSDEQKGIMESGTTRDMKARKHTKLPIKVTSDGEVRERDITPE